MYCIPVMFNGKFTIRAAKIVFHSNSEWVFHALNHSIKSPKDRIHLDHSFLGFYLSISFGSWCFLCIFLTGRVHWVHGLLVASPWSVSSCRGAAAYAERLEKGDGLDETERPRATGAGNWQSTQSLCHSETLWVKNRGDVSSINPGSGLAITSWSLLAW